MGAEACLSHLPPLYSVSTALGCSQAVRQRFLVPPCEGSNPSTPATFPDIVISLGIARLLALNLRVLKYRENIKVNRSCKWINICVYTNDFIIP